MMTAYNSNGDIAEKNCVESPRISLINKVHKSQPRLE